MTDLKCYACDAAATGSRYIAHEDTRHMACDRHRDPPKNAPRYLVGKTGAIQVLSVVPQHYYSQTLEGVCERWSWPGSSYGFTTSNGTLKEWYLREHPGAKTKERIWARIMPDDVGPKLAEIDEEIDALAKKTAALKLERQALLEAAAQRGKHVRAVRTAIKPAPLSKTERDGLRASNEFLGKLGRVAGETLRKVTT